MYISVCGLNSSIVSELDSGGNIVSWGLCIEDCPSEPPTPSCLQPPAVPAFAAWNTTQLNYRASWFQLESVNNTFYQISNVKTRLHRPEWIYDLNNLTDDIIILMESNTEDFQELYTILENGTTVNYTCPLGWIFEGTHNITNFATCHNWTWHNSFNETLACVRKYIHN